MVDVLTNKSDWNLTEQLLFQVDRLLVSANTAFIGGHIDKCFINLKAVKMRVISLFSDGERKNLTELEEKINRQLDYLNFTASSVGGFGKLPKEYYFKRRQTRELVEEYNNLLFDTMERYDLLLRKKKDRTRLN